MPADSDGGMAYAWVWVTVTPEDTVIWVFITVVEVC